VEEKGLRLREGIRTLPGVRSVRGRGLMLAADIDGAPDIVRRALLAAVKRRGAANRGLVSDEEFQEIAASLRG